MAAVTITDQVEDVLAFDLRDILAVLGADAARSKWSISGVECTGAAAADAIHETSDGGKHLDGARLVALALDVCQTIDGTFEGYLPGAEQPWIVICAVDSVAFDVITDREDVLAAIRSRFSRVEDIPE